MLLLLAFLLFLAVAVLMLPQGRMAALRSSIGNHCTNARTDHRRVFLEAVAEARRDCPIMSVLNLDVTCTAKLIPLEVQITD